MYESKDYEAVNSEIALLIAKVSVSPSLGGTSVTMGDGSRFFLFHNKLGTVASVSCDFENPEIRDGGRILALGDYVLSSDWIIKNGARLGEK